MFLHIGEEKTVYTKDILGIFDIDLTTTTKKTREFLAKSEKEKQVENVSLELPRSFLVCENKGKIKVYISQISPKTLKKRKTKEGALCEQPKKQALPGVWGKIEL